MSVAAVRKPSPVAAAPVKPAPAPIAKTRGRAPLYPLGPAIRLRTEQPAGGESQDGKRMFRTSDGQTIELPPDISEEQAARLEVEAKAAQQRLGKGPAPKPVTDVKKLAKKEVKHEKPKPGAKAGRRGGVKAARKAVRALTALLKGLSSSKVAQYLAAKGAPALNKGVAMLQRLAQNEQTHDDAGAKLTQSELAVVNPPSEGQSKSNTGQVGMVADRPAPVADENKAKQKLQVSLQANTPKSIEDVDNFKRDMKAQHMGADVMQVVQGDKNAVTSTFGTIGKTPDPFPPEHTPETLPPQETAPPTPALNLGQGAVAPLQPEHTDVSNFTKDADSKLKEEGVTQEQLDMVDSGDLAAAKKEKKGLENSAKTEPLAVQAFARKQTETVDQELKQEEKKGRDGLRAKHKAELGATTRKQKGTQSALEKKREEVASKINGIYKAAQDSVKKKLDDLETQSMKRFDEGNARATKDFEDNVNREIDAFKDDRYSGWFGWARRAKDWLLGMDDLPEVKAIFDRNRAAFVNTIDKLVADISADNKRVIQECKDELANASKEIKVFVDKLEPNLKEIGKKAAGEMNAKLNELDGFINRKQEELQNKLKDKQTAAIKAIDEKIEKMKEAMAGALAKLGKLLLLAAKKFFTWALEKFGYSLEEIEGIINRGAAVLKAIFTKPVQFVKNLIAAASLGFQNFAKNFLTHLKDAIFDWLTGSLEGVQLPDSWDAKGIASVALQMIGLTWANIRGKLVKATNETTVKALETGFELVVTLVKDGPMAAWEKIVEMADDIKAAFIEGVKDFIKIKIIQKAIETILSLFIPGAGIVRAIVGIYDTVVFFIQKAKQIAQMVGNFLSSIGEIAAGNIGAAANALEKGLAMALKLVINFLAKFLRLDGITAKIRAAIGKLRDKVNSMLDRIVEWIVAKAKKVIGKVFDKKDKDGKPGTPTEQEKERVAGLARQQQRAAVARRIPVAQVVAILDRLKSPYPWIQRFELRRLPNGFAIHMIASDKKIDDVIPHTTETQRPIIDEYVQWLAKYRTAINAVRAMVVGEEKKGKVHKEATRLYRAPTIHLDRIEASVIGGQDSHLLTLIQSLFDERRRLDVDAQSAREGTPGTGTTGETVSQETPPRPFTEYEAFKKGKDLAGTTVSNVREKLGKAHQEYHSDEEGRHWELWKFKDKSSIRLDIPGRLNNSRWQVSRDPHLAIIGPRGEILSSMGVVVPGGSEPAHRRVY